MHYLPGNQAENKVKEIITNCQTENRGLREAEKARDWEKNKT